MWEQNRKLSPLYQRAVFTGRRDKTPERFCVISPSGWCSSGRGCAPPCITRFAVSAKHSRAQHGPVLLFAIREVSESA